jgi:hypothetical protein
LNLKPISRNLIGNLFERITLTSQIFNGGDKSLNNDLFRYLFIRWNAIWKTTSNGYFGQVSKSYALTITVTSGAVQQQTTVTLNEQ